MNALNGGMMELISLRGRLTITRSNRRMRKTACPVVWEGTGKQPGPRPDHPQKTTADMSWMFQTHNGAGGAGPKEFRTNRL